MLSAGRKALCTGSSWLLWRQYSLIRPVARVVKIQQLHGQKRACIDILPSATNKFNWLPWSGRRKFHSSTDLQGKVVPFLLADVGEGIHTVEVKEWLVKVGDTVTLGDAVCEVQSDKAAVTIYVPYDGIVKELMYEVDDVATAGQPLLTIELAEEEDEGSSSECNFKVDHDILDVATNQELNQQQQTPASASTHTTPTTTPPVTTIPSPVIFTHDKVEPVKGIQAVMVKTMTASGKIPQFGYCDEVDVTNLVKLKSHVKEQLLQKGIKFSYMPFIIKAVSTALQHFPILNSHTDPECTTVTYKADHNIGVAMDMPQGLVVPNIKQCQLKTVLEIAVELNRIHKLGLKNQLSPNDMTGGTFSLSNIGAIGGTYTKPMLLPPEVAIGGLGKVQMLPRYDSKGNLKEAHIMHVSWSADHRVIEGATVARFSNFWKSCFEDPTTLISTDLNV